MTTFAVLAIRMLTLRIHIRHGKTLFFRLNVEFASNPIRELMRKLCSREKKPDLQYVWFFYNGKLECLYFKTI